MSFHTGGRLLSILGYAQMLFNDLDENDEHIESVEQIIQAGMRSRDIVRQLLAFSRKQALEFKPLNLNYIIARFEKLLRRTIREDIVIQIKLASYVPPVRGDIGQIEQVIMNLAVNAQDAMADGGTLTFSTHLTALDEENPGFEEKAVPGQYVLLSVDDTGCGIDAETRKKLFEPFFSTKGEYGTGLGLATVYGIVKQHEGYISVCSAPPNGATFNIYLPVSETTETPEESDTISPSDLNGTETVLIVEDNTPVREISREILKRHGYTVLVAENGKEAMSVLDEYKGRVDMILTDVVMPEMDGEKMSTEITGRNPDIKILYMSGYTDDVIAPRGVLDKGVNFIQKPFTLQDLAIKVRKVLDK